MSKVLGIDPGCSPALAFMTADSCRVLRVPSSGYLPDEARLRDIIVEEAPDCAVIENVGAMAGQGVSSIAHFCMSIGVIRGILSGLRIPYTLVTPNTWKKATFTTDELGDHLSDRSLRKEHQKRAATAFVRREYPAVNLIPKGCRTPDHNMAEAVILARWGRMHSYA